MYVKRDDADEYDFSNNDAMARSFYEHSASGEQHSENRAVYDSPLSLASVSSDMVKSVMSGSINTLQSSVSASEHYSLYGDSTLDRDTGESEPPTRLPAMLTKFKLAGEGKEPIFLSVLKSKSELIASKTSKSWNIMIDEAQVGKLSALKMVPYFGRKTNSYFNEASSSKCHEREVSFDYQLMSDVDYSSAPKTCFLKQ
eukprot:CCRYP_009667-RA/>CCRYP_009667-RA protein AED:0.03 eAED:0.03 QI:197/1/1/1/0/0/2/396/198